jgi:hypothetical protein
MERSYNGTILLPVLHEIMHANAFCVKATGGAVAFDEQNEYYNLRLKKTPVTPLLDLAIMRLHHAMVGDKAAKEMWGLTGQCSGTIRGRVLESEISKFECVLNSCCIFVDHKAKEITKDFFLECHATEGCCWIA